MTLTTEMSCLNKQLELPYSINLAQPLIQRKLKLGYNRAGRIIDQLETARIVGPFEGSKARQVLIRDEMALDELLNQLNKTN